MHPLVPTLGRSDGGIPLEVTGGMVTIANEPDWGAEIVPERFDRA